jgi:hypothetical protein
VTFEDLHATILGYAGAPQSPDHQGIGLRARIEGFGKAPRSHIIGVQDGLRVRESEFVPPISLGGVIRMESGAFLRTPEWRYIEYLNRGERALYRIDQDPLEEVDVATDHPQLLESFAARTAAWRNDLAKPAAWMDLMGRFVSEDNTIGSGLRLWLEGQDASGADVRMLVFSDARGYFRIPNVPAGEYVLEYETMRAATDSLGEVPQTATRALDLVDYQTAPFITLDVASAQPEADPNASAPGAIHIEVVDRRGESATGLPLTIHGWTNEGRRELRVSSGADGFVVLDQLPGGFYLASAERGKRYRRSSRWVYLSPGSTRNVELRIKEPRERGNHRRSARGRKNSHAHQ